MELKFDKKTVRRLLLCAVAIIVVYWLLHDSGQVKNVLGGIMDILTPFIVGAVLAFIINVPMRAFENLFKEIKNPRLRRCVALIATLLCIALVLTIVMMLLIPQLTQTIKDLVVNLPIQVKRFWDNIMQALATRPNIQAWLMENLKFESIDWSSLVNKGLNIVGDGISILVPQAFSAIGVVFSALFNAFISIAFAFYSLFQKEALARQGRKILYSLFAEKHADYIVKVLRLTNKTFSNFLSGQCVEVCILGSLFAITMAIFNLGRQYIALISVLVAVTAFIPVVGAWIGCVVGAFLIMVSTSFVDALWFVVLSVVVQQVENNFIYPRVVGTSIGLSGMWVLVAVALGGEMIGVIGMFLMIPVTSVVYVLIQEFVHNRLGDRHIPEEKLTPQPPDLESHFKLRIERKKAMKKKSKAEKAESEKK